MNLRHFTNALKKYRQNNNLTQAKFAELLGISENYLSLLECGKRNPSLQLLISISDITNVSMFDLIGVNSTYDKTMELDTITHYILNMSKQEKSTLKNFLNLLVDIL